MTVNKIQLSEITDQGKLYALPSSVLVEVCYTCKHCVHCCLDNHSTSGLNLMQYELLFDQMVEAGTFYVIFTGGEPFTRADFIDILKASRKRRLCVTIFTNATLITEEQIHELRDLYVDEVHVSIYSANPVTHDRITRMKGSFTKSIATIIKMLSAGITVRIKCPLMNTTADEIDEIRTLARDLSIHVQYTSVITAKNDGNTATHAQRLTQMQLSRILSDPTIFAQGSKPIYFQENLECIPCDAVFNGGAIDPLGNVYVCNQLRISGGNILEKPLIEIWKNSTVFQRLREIRLRDLKKCNHCELFQYCTRCPGLADLEDDDLLGCSSAAKAVAEVRRTLGIFPTESHIFSKPLAREEKV